MPGDDLFDSEHTAARKVLLDALEALGRHRNAVVLVGAQAIYLRVGESPDSDLPVAPYTTDGDLAIDPRKLEDKPELAMAMAAANFELTLKPGTWTLKQTDLQIDFLVPTALAGSGRRGARLGPHGNDVARKATGLEAVVVDNSVMHLVALDPSDARTFDIAVAGPAAMVVAKLYKLEERRNNEARLNAKDALDLLRIFRHESADALASTLTGLKTDPIAGVVVQKARGYLADLFADRSALGPQLAAHAAAGLGDEELIAISCEVLARQLLDRWR